jgi:hypothetical protein
VEAVQETPSVRGMLVLNTFEFVRAHYGPAPHTAVLATLPAQRAALDAVRENSWMPLQDLLAYMEEAKALLAPGDLDFYRKMGFYGGRHVRALPIAVAVSEVAQAVRLGRIVWRTFFDTGEVEVVESRREGAMLRIHDFPSAPSLCQRLVGSVEGVLSLAAMPVRVEERACTSRGDPYCEILVARSPSWQHRERPGAPAFPRAALDQP